MNPQATHRTVLALLVFALSAGSATAAPPASEYNLGVNAYRLKDYTAARQHWTRAADEHEATAYNNLGFLLYYGKGGPADPLQAVWLWKKAARLGETESQWHLGHAYEAGKGIPASAIEAYAWYRCALANFPATPRDDEDGLMMRDARDSLARVREALAFEDLGAAEKLAAQYIAQYSTK